MTSSCSSLIRVKSIWLVVLTVWGPLTHPCRTDPVTSWPGRRGLQTPPTGSLLQRRSLCQPPAARIRTPHSAHLCTTSSHRHGTWGWWTVWERDFSCWKNRWQNNSRGSKCYSNNTITSWMINWCKNWWWNTQPCFHFCPEKADKVLCSSARVIKSFDTLLWNKVFCLFPVSMERCNTFGWIAWGR